MLDHLSDEELASRCRDSMSSTREVFSVLYQRHHAGLFAFLRRYLGSVDGAEDALQETFLRVFRNLNQFEPDKSLNGWLYTVALNVARDAVRRNQVRRREVEAPRPAAAASPEDSSVRGEEKETLDRLILGLPEEERAVFIQARVQGRKLQEVADSMGFSLRTTKNRLAGALGRLEKDMTAQGFV